MDIAAQVFRCARSFDLVPYNRLPAYSDRFADVECLNGDGFGVALSLDNNGAQLEIDADTALLLYVLEQPGLLPDHVLRDSRADVTDRVMDLVYSKLLEIRVDGQFISGADAVLHFSSPCDPRSRLARLSHEAVRQALCLDDVQVHMISSSLYRYHTVPGSRKVRTRLRNEQAYLGIDALRAHWRVSNADGGWYYCHSRRDSSEVDEQAKLYVSPVFEALPDAVRITADTLSGHPGTSFKIGTDVSGLLRPDKLIAYFPSVDSLLTVSAELQQRLGTMPAHGVPFTASLSADGLLSWGVDPNQVPGAERKSWRQWIVERLAQLIAEYKLDPEYHTEKIRHEETGVAPDNGHLQRILARLSLDGVDINTFQPRHAWIREHRSI